MENKKMISLGDLLRDALLRGKFDELQKEKQMLRDALVLGFTTNIDAVIIFNTAQLKEIAEAAHRDKVKAIKAVREYFTIGLAEAKDFIDAVCAIFPHTNSVPDWNKLLSGYRHLHDERP